MVRRDFLLSGTAFLSAFALRAQSGSYKLDVNVSYTGSGTVDDAHKIYVVLWDSADFMKGDGGAPPIGGKAVASKTGTAQFTNIAKGPVYVSMVYDPSGKWDAASPPPSGCALGLYSKEPGTPAPIELEAGKTAKVSATFDDSMKMP